MTRKAKNKLRKSVISCWHGHRNTACLIAEIEKFFVNRRNFEKTYSLPRIP